MVMIEWMIIILRRVVRVEGKSLTFPITVPLLPIPAGTPATGASAYAFTFFLISVSRRLTDVTFLPGSHPLKGS